MSTSHNGNKHQRICTAVDPFVPLLEQSFPPSYSGNLQLTQSKVLHSAGGIHPPKTFPSPTDAGEPHQFWSRRGEGSTETKNTKLKLFHSIFLEGVLPCMAGMLDLINLWASWNGHLFQIRNYLKNEIIWNLPPSQTLGHRTLKVHNFKNTQLFFKCSLFCSY